MLSVEDTRRKVEDGGHSHFLAVLSRFYLEILINVSNSIFFVLLNFMISFFKQRGINECNKHLHEIFL